jgi:enamine deaminase RidA (YjgF/YER057c/UK114 family)
VTHEPPGAFVHGADSTAQPEAVSGQVPEPPSTGDGAVDEALTRLARAAGEPLDAQLPLLDAVHRTLQDRLADVEG